jgi:hypothetical protein
MEPYNEIQESKEPPKIPDGTSINRTGVVDIYKQIGNKEFHIIRPVIGGSLLKCDEKDIIIPSNKLRELGQWLIDISAKFDHEVERAHKFEVGE